MKKVKKFFSPLLQIVTKFCYIFLLMGIVLFFVAAVLGFKGRLSPILLSFSLVISCALYIKDMVFGKCSSFKVASWFFWLLSVLTALLYSLNLETQSAAFVLVIAGIWVFFKVLNYINEYITRDAEQRL